MRKVTVIFLLFLAITIPAMAEIPEDHSAAVILAYGRVGEDAYPDTGLRAEQFQDHLEEIVGGRYNVLPLPEIITALKSGTPLPERTLAITFEGGYKSAFDNAMNKLLEHKIPFTVFYAADKLDENSTQFMGEADLKFLHKYPGVTFGVLPAPYTRLAGEPEETLRAALNRTQTRHREIFGENPALFSYPFGEYSSRYKSILAGYDYTAAFTLNSGTASPASDILALPRFSMTENHGDIERFRLIARALPLPVSELTPAAPADPATAPGFTVTQALEADIKNLSCFISDQPKPELSIIAARVELRPASALTQERTRLNCTLPAADNRTRWFGMLLLNTHPAEEEIKEEPRTEEVDELP